jgi:hypothetical protein
MEAADDFKVIAAGINTHHNATMDYLTRAKREAYQQEMTAKGFQEVDFWPKWKALFENLEAGHLLVTPGGGLEDRQAAQRVVARRTDRCVSPLQRSSLALMEWRPTIGSYCRAWRARGAAALFMREDRNRTDWTCVQEPDVVIKEPSAALQGKVKCDWLCASLSPDKTGIEMAKCTRLIQQCGSTWALVDAPKEAGLEEGLKELGRSHGFIVFPLLTRWKGKDTRPPSGCPITQTTRQQRKDNKAMRPAQLLQTLLEPRLFGCIHQCPSATTLLYQPSALSHLNASFVR